MSPQEAAVDVFDAPEKPFDTQKLTGEPDDSPLTLAALGLPAETPSEEGTEAESAEGQVDDPNAAKLLDKYSAKIQEQSEELYGTYLLRAKEDPAFLERLVQSQDKVERKFAEKILKRNPDLFKAKSIEEYQHNKALDLAGEDPTARKLVELELHQKKQEKSQQDSTWEDFKREQKITGDFASLCDDLRAEHPDLPTGKLVAMAKGLSSGGATPKSKREHSSASGGANPAEEASDVWSHPLLGRMLREPNAIKDTKKFAREYFGQ